VNVRTAAECGICKETVKIKVTPLMRKNKIEDPLLKDLTHKQIVEEAVKYEARL